MKNTEMSKWDMQELMRRRAEGLIKDLFRLREHSFVVAPHCYPISVAPLAHSLLAILQTTPSNFIHILLFSVAFLIPKSIHIQAMNADLLVICQAVIAYFSRPWKQRRTKDKILVVFTNLSIQTDTDSKGLSDMEPLLLILAPWHVMLTSLSIALFSGDHMYVLNVYYFPGSSGLKNWSTSLQIQQSEFLSSSLSHTIVLQRPDEHLTMLCQNLFDKQCLMNTFIFLVNSELKGPVLKSSPWTRAIFPPRIMSNTRSSSSRWVYDDTFHRITSTDQHVCC